MQKHINTRLARGIFLDRDLERLRQQLGQILPFLSRRKPTTSMAEFDVATERLIGQVFGEASELLETYEYAKWGEAASLVNLPEEAQESGARNVERESLQQRKRVLESCLATLEGRRYIRATGGRVSDYMSREARSIDIDATMQDAGKLLQKLKVGSLLVQDLHQYVGIVTDTDLSRRGVARGLDPSSTPVTKCMSEPIITIEEREPMTAAISLMKERAVRHLAVTIAGSITGVLSVADILRYYAELVPTLRDLAGLTPEAVDIVADD